MNVLHAHRRIHTSSVRSARPQGRSLVVRAQDAPTPGSSSSTPDEEAFEARLRALRVAKGQTPYGEGKKAAEKKEKVQQLGSRKDYDFSTESVYYEGPPHRGDLAVNLGLLITIFWLPLTIAAVGRSAFVKYRFTDRRMSVITDAPWQKERLDVPYQEVKKVVSVPRGVGAWGDMAVTLKDGSVAELRALDRFKELQEYILKRRDELVAEEEKARKKPSTSGSAPSGGEKKTGFAA